VPTRPGRQADRILDVAARLFGARRFHEVRMEDIAAEADVGKGTLYRYFRDKDELFFALVERAAVQLNCRVNDSVTQVHGTQGKLEALVRTIITFFDEQPHLFDLIQRSEVLRGPNVAWRQTRDELVGLTLRVFTEARERGDFAITDPELAALMLLGALRSVIRFGERPRPADLMGRIVANFLSGAAHRPGP
jgi:TetR/AcrR family fatty acid metabolism transcriptional regulator